ncbi:MAG: ATP-binding protein, partial [Oscillospiraceae bacterium]|nr:ATP-binding protein [Oscillospiraceae bacterium]
RRISRQRLELERRQEEFAAVTDNMNEGLLLLDARGSVLAINPAAGRFYGSSEDCLGRDILTVERSPEIQGLISRALAGEKASLTLERGGREYRVSASPVSAKEGIAGAALLSFDITEQAFAERQRREFSANVSHELKTPLHAIMGSAELLENGLVKKEDMPRFTGHIRTEAARLVSLIDDIIRLSQLDEGLPLPSETLELGELAGEIVSALEGEAAARGVSLELKAGSASVSGARRLVYEIIYNLIENAIKYNRDGGRVIVEIEDMDSRARLKVSDTGIGIPEEDKARVFERFYRVDKSHSKQTGGTGLGLSIVKHAAQYLGAELELESEAGRGTEISVLFKKQP